MRRKPPQLRVTPLSIFPPLFPLSLSFSFPFSFLFTSDYTLSHNNRTVSYERRHYSVGWNSVFRVLRLAPRHHPSPRFSPSTRSVPPLTASFANPRRPLFFVTCRLFGFAFSLSLSLHLSPSHSSFLSSLSPSLSGSPSDFRLVLYCRLSYTACPLERLSPFSSSTSKS